MASLTETAFYARKGVNIGIILCIGLVILRILFVAAVGIKDRYFPPRLPPATCAFGTLPTPNSQSNIASQSGIQVSNEVPDLPVLPANLKVFFLPDSTTSFGSFEKMKQQAGQLGFTSTPKRLSAQHWQFVDPSNPLRTLDYDEIFGNFHLVYNYSSDLSLFNEKNFSSVQSVMDEATSFFESVASAEEIKSATQSAVFLKLENDKLNPTTSLSNADAVAVTLIRPQVEQTPIVSPNLGLGLVSAIMSGNPDPKKRVLEANFYYHPIDTQNAATYPTKTAVEAIESLKSGQGSIASLPKVIPSSFIIRSVSLAYLDPFPFQPYLQPIYVFSDEKGFTQYVPAIRPDCSKK